MVFVVNLFRCQIDGLPLNPDALSSIPVIRVKNWCNGTYLQFHYFCCYLGVWKQKSYPKLPDSLAWSK